MSSGNYDRRAPAVASQIIILERLLEATEAHNEKLEAKLAALETTLSYREEATHIMNALLSAGVEEWDGYEGAMRQFWAQPIE